MTGFLLKSAAQSGYLKEQTYEIGDVNIITERIECVDVENGTAKELISLNFFNQGPDAISVSFAKELWYDGKCTGCGGAGDEFRTTLVMEGRETISGGCDERELTLFSKMIHLKKVRRLTHFELKDIRVTKL